MILSLMFSFLTLKMLIIYLIIQVLFSLALGFKVWSFLEKMKKKHNNNKHKEFRRTDVDKWSKWRFMLGIVFLFPIRVFLIISMVTQLYLLLSILSIGHDLKKPMTGYRK